MRILLALASVVLVTYAAHSLHVGEFARPGDEGIFVLGFVLLASFLCGELASRASLPLISGYLLAGVLFGPLSARLFSQQFVAIPPAAVAGLRVIDSVALGLIAFTAGGEIKIESLRKGGRVVLAATGLQIVAILLCVGAVTMLLSPLLPFPESQPVEVVAACALLLAAAMVPNSAEAVVAVTNECRARGRVAELSLEVTVLKDIAAVVVFLLAASAAEFLVSGRGGVRLATVGGVAWEIAGSLGVGALLGFLLGVYIEKLGAELPVVVVGLGFSSMYLAAGARLSGLLICLVAGMVIENFSRKGEALVRAVEAYSLPVYVVFFTIAGARVDLGALLQVWPLAVVVAVARGAAIAWGTRRACVKAKEPAEVRAYAWLGFLSQAGVGLGLATLMMELLGDVGRSVATVAIATIALNLVVGPVAFRWALVRAGEANRQ